LIGPLSMGYPWIMKRHLFLLALILCAPGCFALKVDNEKAVRSEYREREHFFLFGLVGEATVDLPAICSKGVGTFGDQMSPLDGALTILSLGLYTPRTVIVECVS